MSEKPIIIDGVDVSECKNFIPIYTEDTDVEVNNCCTLTYTHCHKYHENCYFKQLQRLKSEFAEILDAKCGTIAALKVENDELKAKLERIKILANGRLSLCEGCEGNLKTGWCDEPCTAYYIKEELK